MRILKSVSMGFMVGMLSVSSVQAYTYNTVDTVDTAPLYNGGSGSTLTTYTAAGIETVGGNTYMSYNSANFQGSNTGDNLLASTHMANSGDGAEKSFIADVLGVGINDLDFTQTNLKANVAESSTGLSTLTGGVESGYFLLKFGGGPDKEVNWLFDNSTSTSNFTWLTMIAPTNKNAVPLPLSHVSFASCKDGVECGTPGSEVPIPAAIWLFGSALLGFTAFGSKKKAA